MSKPIAAASIAQVHFAKISGKDFAIKILRPGIEKKFNETVRSKFALACSSGTAALHLALMSLGLKKNDNVIIPKKKNG